MTDRPVLLCCRTTSRTRSARFAGSAAVISSSRITSGSTASARARSSTLRMASGTSRAMSRTSRSGTPSSRTQARNGSSGVPVRRRLETMSRSGISDGSWYTGTRPARRASAGRAHVASLATDMDTAFVCTYCTGQDLHQGRLARAVRAHQRVDLARQHRQRRVAQRCYGAVVFRHARGVEDRVRRQCAISMLRSGDGRQFARRPRSQFMSEIIRRGLCRPRSVPWCRSSSQGSRSKPATQARATDRPRP